MGFPVTLLLLIIAIVIAIVSLTVKDLLAAVIILAAFSFTAALLYAEMGAVDVSFTEAAVGAGISGVFMIAAIFFLKRRSED
jgi:energy-converting hydrogenase B subunit D